MVPATVKYPRVRNKKPAGRDIIFANESKSSLSVSNNQGEPTRGEEGYWGNRNNRVTFR
jgi:hypothetical protein